MLKTPKLIGERVDKIQFGKKISYLTYEFPDGTTDEFLCLGSAKGTLSTIIFPITTKGEVIAVRQFRYGANEFVVELPGGNPKSGENVFQVAQMELLEETGYSPKKLVGLPAIEYFFDPASYLRGYYGVIAIGCEKVAEPKPDKTEKLEPVIISPTEWEEMILRGEIRDSKTITLTHLAEKLGYFRIF